ncbi:MAG: translation initiation factor IF-2, partial [Oscillospiraceae bacterium]|nr:translation initiation factor IF-2 [Candidatus Equicaccousia limihippi]
MATSTKIKVSDIAKDFNMASKEIIEIFKPYSKEEKKSSNTLSEEEIGLLFDLLTVRYAVDSFDDYFKMGEKASEERKKQKDLEKQRKLAEQAAILEQFKKEAAKQMQEGKKVSEEQAVTTEVEKPAVMPTSPKKAEPKPAAKEKPKAQEKPKAEKPAAKTEDKKAIESAKTEPAAKEGKKQSYTKALADKLKAESAAGKKDQEYVPVMQKKEKQGGPAPNRGPGEIRVVDTRTSHVELDKYNEKYENIAPANSYKDNLQHKQKIKQRSRDRRPAGAKRETEADKLRRLQLEKIKKTPITVKVPQEGITLGDLAAAMKKTAAEVIKVLLKLGVMATVTETLDYDTAEILVTEMGGKVEKVVTVSIEERIMDVSVDAEEDLKQRDPVVVVMGHVDHGKTSLLDAIRDTQVTAGEAGGITQHIGAYRVNKQGKNITFLDTPGHAAFTSMRKRGAMATDIAVLVVAADDGIMPQTIEAISHAKSAGVQIIVAVNKIDIPGANPDRVLQQLTEHSLAPEAWGGDVICVPVSAKTHEGIDKLLENILLVAEMLDLKANPDRKASGVVIEARLDKGRGPVATLLVKNGTLHQGDILVAGTSVGRVRNMVNEYGKTQKEAGPAVPVEITGLVEVPEAGDTFDAVSDEKLARELVEQRRQKIQEEKWSKESKVTLDNLFESLESGDTKSLNIIIKPDVQGSVEAVRESLEKLSNDEGKDALIHGGVGAITESDGI